MSRLQPWLDPSGCPTERPPLDGMSSRTRDLHDSIDAHARRTGTPWLHPEEPTVQLDLLGSAQMIAWQEAKAACVWTEETCWSELPQVYARYGTGITGALLTRVRDLEHAAGALLVDSGMQAWGLLADALLAPGQHVVVGEQIYNKTRTLFEWNARRLGGEVTIVPDGDPTAFAEALRPTTRLLVVETFTNPLLRVQDIDALVALTRKARDTFAPELRLVVDDTVATPWGARRPLLTSGVDVVLASGTKALGGQDTDLWGYLASNHIPLLNSLMDMAAMRGGLLDWRRAHAILAHLDQAEIDHARRCTTATEIAAFLATHPRVSEVWHPSVPTHPDHKVYLDQYDRPGSLLSFRVHDLDEDGARRLADALATCTIVRYALSFDGLTTKVNHHRTVSEYFTPEPVLRRRGLDRLVRLAVGLEEAQDVIAALNWALWHGMGVTEEEIGAWQGGRRAGLGL